MASASSGLPSRSAIAPGASACSGLVLFKLVLRIRARCLVADGPPGLRYPMAPSFSSRSGGTASRTRAGPRRALLDRSRSSSRRATRGRAPLPVREVVRPAGSRSRFVQLGRGAGCTSSARRGRCAGRPAEVPSWHSDSANEGSSPMRSPRSAAQGFDPSRRARWRGTGKLQDVVIEVHRARQRVDARPRAHAGPRRRAARAASIVDEIAVHILACSRALRHGPM